MACNMTDTVTNEDRDRRALELYEKVLEIEQRLIPTGLHVFGRASGDVELVDLLTMVASFDRPELGIRPLPDLVAEGLGVNVHYSLIYQHPYYRSCFTVRDGDCPEAELASRQLLSLPMFHGMTDAAVGDVVQAVSKVISSYAK